MRSPSLTPHRLQVIVGSPCLAPVMWYNSRRGVFFSCTWRFWLRANEAVKEKFKSIGFSPDLWCWGVHRVAPCPGLIRTPLSHHYFLALLLEELTLHKRSRHSHYFWAPDRDKFTHGVFPRWSPMSTRCWLTVSPSYLSSGHVWVWDSSHPGDGKNSGG